MSSEATTIVNHWKHRLRALAADPPFVFRDTPQKLIDEYLRRKTTFVGYTKREIAAAESHLGVKFSEVFACYLREMGKSAGDLFQGSELARLGTLVEFRRIAAELMAETDAALRVPPNTIVYLIHQGYSLLLVNANGGFDGPTSGWAAGDLGPPREGPNFAALIDAELDGMEDVDRATRASGGYYLTLHPDGETTATYPSESNGERPFPKS